MTKVTDEGRDLGTANESQCQARAQQLLDLNTVRV
jgi:hypothetical protein